MDGWMDVQPVGLYSDNPLCICGDTQSKSHIIIIAIVQSTSLKPVSPLYTPLPILILPESALTQPCRPS